MAKWLDNLRSKRKREEKLAREMSHSVTNEPVRIPDIANTALSRLASGKAMLTGRPIVESLREQMNADPVQTGMDWLAPGVGMIGSIAGKTANALNKAKTEFELAHEVAQRNAALPIEQGGLGLPPNNTAIDRAKAMGFDTPAYHASDADISAFDVNKLGSATAENTDSEWASRLARAGVWSADEDVTLAARRALGKEGGMLGDVVYPLLIEKPSTTARSLDTLERQLKKGKLRGTTKVNDEEFRVTSYISPVPTRIRSRFAAFDPMQRNSANILAGGAAGAVGLSSLADLMNQQDYQ